MESTVLNRNLLSFIKLKCNQDKNCRNIAKEKGELEAKMQFGVLRCAHIKTMFNT